MKRAVFPGSFDPITLGHCDIIDRGLEVFDEIILGIGINASKKYMFSLEERKIFLEETYKDNPKIKVMTYEGLTVDFCEQVGAPYILRGLRSLNDLEFERPIAQANYKMKNIETVFLTSSSGLEYISSTIVRDVMRFGGDYSEMVPEPVRFKRD